jgi:2'-5' RNA ligase
VSITDLSPGEHASRVRDHWWWRPGWRVGRRFYAFHITFEDQPDVQRLVGVYRQALADFNTLTIVPDRWLHMTMQGIGFTDEIPRSALEAVANETASRLADIPPAKVTVGDIVVADEAIAMLVGPEAPIRKIRSASRSGISRALGNASEDEQRFRPHVSVAYVAADGCSDLYVSAVRDIVGQSARLVIRHLDLIEMHRDNRMYEWKVLRRLEFGA